MLVNHYSTPVTIRPVSTADRNPNVSRLACAPGSCIQSAVVHMHARALTSRETPRDCLRKHASDWYAHLQTLLEILHSNLHTFLHSSEKKNRIAFYYTDIRIYAKIQHTLHFHQLWYLSSLPKLRAYSTLEFTACV